MRSYLVGLIGSGIDGSLTPPMHEHEADAHGIRYLYRPIDIDRLGLSPEEAVQLVPKAAYYGYDALNITHPCKQLVLDVLDELSPDAAKLGAVNTVLLRDGKAIGHNTDHSGYATGLRSALKDPKLGRVVLLGSGGAGSAIAYALLNAGAGRLDIFDPMAGRAEALRSALAPHFPSAVIEPVQDSDALGAAITAADGLMNATPIGMVGHPGMPIDPELLHAGLWVGEAVYRPMKTEMLERAAALGCQTLDGGRMAVGQAIDTFRLITGVEPDAERMREHFLELVRQGADAR